MSASNNWINNLTKSLRADPKKAGALLVLVALFLVMVARQFVFTGKQAVPQSAGAATARTTLTPAIAAKGTNPSGTIVRPAGARAELQKWLTAPVPAVSRNLFAVRMEYFPVDGSRTVPSGPTEDGFWSRLEKSMAIQADQKDKQENLRANFKEQASKLRVESTMPGPQPRAMVNGDLVGEGSVVAGFRVLKIEARRITIEREGIQLEIQMK